MVFLIANKVIIKIAEIKALNAVAVLIIYMNSLAIVSTTIAMIAIRPIPNPA